MNKVNIYNKKILAVLGVIFALILSIVPLKYNKVNADNIFNIDLNEIEGTNYFDISKLTKNTWYYTNSNNNYVEEITNGVPEAKIIIYNKDIPIYKGIRSTLTLNQITNNQLIIGEVYKIDIEINNATSNIIQLHNGDTVIKGWTNNTTITITQEYLNCTIIFPGAKDYNQNNEGRATYNNIRITKGIETKPYTPNLYAINKYGYNNGYNDGYNKGVEDALQSAFNYTLTYNNLLTKESSINATAYNNDATITKYIINDYPYLNAEINSTQTGLPYSYLTSTIIYYYFDTTNYFNEPVKALLNLYIDPAQFNITYILSYENENGSYTTLYNENVTSAVETKTTIDIPALNGKKLLLRIYSNSILGGSPTATIKVKGNITNDLSGLYTAITENAYNEGKKDGLKEGEEIGYNKGKQDGFTEGQDIGIKTGYQSGYDNGIADKIQYGEQEYKRGYDNGYAVNANTIYENITGFGILTSGFTAVFNAMDIDIFYGKVSIVDIMNIFLAIMVVIWVLSFLK